MGCRITSIDSLHTSHSARKSGNVLHVPGTSLPLMGTGGVAAWAWGTVYTWGAVLGRCGLQHEIGVQCRAGVGCSTGVRCTEGG